MTSSTAVGPLPVLTDPSTWASAWAREKARLDVTDALADATFRGINPVRPANPIAKQTSEKPHALVPPLDDRASSITVVRRSRKVGYRRSYLSFMDDAPANPPLVPTFDYILTPFPVHRGVRLGRPHGCPVDDRPQAPGRAHRPPRSLASGRVLELCHGDPLVLLPVDSRVVVRGGGHVRLRGGTPVGPRVHGGRPPRGAAYPVGHLLQPVGPPQGAAEQGKDERRRERGDHHPRL